MDIQFATFEEFWPHYLREHGDSLNRRFHAAGTTAALILAAVALATKKPKLLPLVPLVGYGPAWLGHFLIEGNSPATLKHPLWSLRADLRMWRLLLTGQFPMGGVQDQAQCLDDKIQFERLVHNPA